VHVGEADKCTLWGRSGKRVGPTVISAIGENVTLDKCCGCSA
jgi:hypothetical protein